MKFLKEIFEKFLELRKSPICILISLSGFCDILAILFNMSFYFPFEIGISLDLFMLSMCYFALRIAGFPYYSKIIILLFIFEKIFKTKLNNHFINTNTLYKYLWLIGFILMTVNCFLIPTLFNKVYDHNYF